MNEHSFSLIPFRNSKIPDLQIIGTVSRRYNIFFVRFVVTGQINFIFFPEKTIQPKRKDDLWKTTCFEFFFAVPDKPDYWEFNMSPSGDWNAYHMDAYRQVGLREETCIQQLEFSIEKSGESIFVESKVDLTDIIEKEQPIQAAITSVIEDQNQHETYWALTHPGPEADFHRREGFIIQL